MKQIGDVLKELFDNLSTDEMGKYQGIFRKWDDIVGNDLADHVKIKDIERDRIVVETDHPGWMQQFQMKQRYFLKIIRDRYPDLGIRGFKMYLTGKDR
jgi:predicted nucleic acid-binding Zn ribbon protein